MSKSRIEKAYIQHTLNKASKTEEAFLAHHGILGQKWGVRRYQNYDGTRTAAGKKRYSNDEFHAPMSLKEANERHYESNKNFDKEKFNKSVDEINKSIEQLKVKKADKELLKGMFRQERQYRYDKRNAHYGTYDDPELIELIQLEIDGTNSMLVDISNRYKSQKVDSVIKSIKSFDSYTDGLYSDYTKGNEYMFSDDIIDIYKNRLK